MEVIIKKKILVAIGNRGVCEILSSNLENEGYDACMAFSIKEALQKLTLGCDLIMINIMPNDKRKFNLIKKHCKKNDIPIIFLAKLKPLIFKTLFDYVKIVLKIDYVKIVSKIEKTESIAESPMKIGRLCIDPLSKKVKIDNSAIPLTKAEYEILYMLASNPLKTYSRDQILDAIWKDSKGSVTFHAADMHIARLRKKLGRISCCIFNRPGFGYEFDPRILISDENN